jgi:integration host factor subunit beta
MTRSELLKKLSARYPNLFLRDLSAIIDEIFLEISQAMIENRRVEIRGFGAFTVRSRKARTARNPRTSEIVELSERLSLYFRAGKELRARLNKNKP